jgi:transketolase
MDIGKKAADNIRRLVAASVQNARSGHPGGAMGGADFIHVLYSEFLEYDPENGAWDLRDRFFLDPGHMSMMLYSILAMSGFLTMEDLKNFRKWGSHTPGHPERDLKRGIENTSGPLGLGHAMGIGAAIAEKFLEARFGSWMKHNVFSLISDGGIQEEISQGAGRIAGHLGLGNFTMFYDSNDVQLSSKTSDVTSEEVEAKYRAWGWHVLIIDGNNHDEIRNSLKEAISVKDKPSLIIGKTKIAYGAIDKDGKTLEGDVSTHGAPLGLDATRNTIIQLGGDPDDPFQIDFDVKELYEKRKKELLSLVKIKECARSAWEKEKPDLSQKNRRDGGKFFASSLFILMFLFITFFAKKLDKMSLFSL